MKKLEMLPRAMIAAERNALEAFYNERRRAEEGSQLELRRPNYDSFEAEATKLLTGSIYPTTRAPDYVVDQLGYGETVEERRGLAVPQRSGRGPAFVSSRRIVRRTRSGIIASHEEEDVASGARTPPQPSGRPR